MDARSVVSDPNEIKLPAKFTAMSIFETEHSEDTKDHNAIKTIIIKSFSL